MDKILADSAPYYGATFNFLTLFWTFLINVGLIAVFSSAVFVLAGETRAFVRPRTIGYWLLTTFTGFFIDLFFLYLAGAFYGYQDEFTYILQTPDTHFRNLTWLIVPSLVAYVLLFVVQLMLISLLFKEIGPQKKLVMSAIIAFLTLPAWGTIVILVVHNGGFKGLIDPRFSWPAGGA